MFSIQIQPIDQKYFWMGQAGISDNILELGGVSKP